MVRWVVAVVAVAIIVPVAVVVVPIVLHRDAGSPGQQELIGGGPIPLEARSTGADGRTRDLRVQIPVSANVEAIRQGDRLIVRGSGYDASQGIYVAVCAVPDSAADKPGPCLGGVPDQVPDEVTPGSVQYATSNWINDALAWKMFGSRAWDDPSLGSFTAYLVIGDPVTDALDCTQVVCAVYTRNDHTAASDRSQDLYVPLDFAS